MSDIEQRLRGENPEHCVVTDRLRANIGMPDTFQFDRDDAVELDELVLEAADELARLEADNASLRSKLEEAEGALPPVKPLDLAAVIRDSFLAGAGMDTSKRETQRIPEDVYERLNKYDPEHVPAFKRLEALLSAAYRARRTIASLREADHA